MLGEDIYRAVLGRRSSELGTERKKLFVMKAHAQLRNYSPHFEKNSFKIYPENYLLPLRFTVNLQYVTKIFI